MILFHITTEANARNILKHGFEGEFEATDKKDLASWVFAFTADQFAAGKRSDAIILRFEVTKSQIVYKAVLGKEGRTEFLVTPPVNKLKVFKKVNVLKQGRRGGLKFDEEKEPIKFGSRKKTAFARR